MELQHGIYVVWTTLPDPTQAQRIARTLVEERLAACAQIDAPMRSIYRWQGRIEEDEEVRLWLKTPADRLSSLCDRLTALHPYQTPQILATPAEAAPDYARWAQEVSRSDA